MEDRNVVLSSLQGGPQVLVLSSLQGGPLQSRRRLNPTPSLHLRTTIAWWSRDKWVKASHTPTPYVWARN